MRVVRFSDEYGTVSVLYDMSSAELKQRDLRRGQPVQRWFATEGLDPVAAASCVTRPDGRTFISFVGNNGAVTALIETALADLSGDLCTMVTDVDSSRSTAVRNAGFVAEVATERFEIRFESAIAALSRFRVPVGFAFESADAVDEERLFSLDNAIRNSVPGLDGWRGNRAWFQAELADPASYQVAIDLGTGAYAGLARMWRNPEGAHFGLVGIGETYRRLRLGPALLNKVIGEASGWGHPTFTADTALTNQQVHPRLKRLGAKSHGTTTQFVLRR